MESPRVLMAEKTAVLSCIYTMPLSESTWDRCTIPINPSTLQSISTKQFTYDPPSLFQRSNNLSSDANPCMYFCIELLDFNIIQRRYCLDLVTYEDSLQSGLREYLKKNEAVQAMLIGTRSTDPFAGSSTLPRLRRKKVDVHHRAHENVHAHG